MSSNRLRFAVVALASVAGLSALSCADDPSGPGARVPNSLVVISGAAQSGVVGTELAQPLVVEVRDGSNNPLPGVVVNFVVVKGGGTVFAGAAETDNNGRAQDYWTLGTSTADSQKVEVRSVSGSTGAKELHGVFTATAQAGAPTRVVIAVDSIQLNFVGDTATAPASVLDQYGNTNPGAVIIWRLAAPGAVTLDSITGLTTAIEPGRRRLIAAVGARRDTTWVVVTPVVANIEPPAETLAVNSLEQNVTPAFVAYDSAGTVIGSPGGVVWTSLNNGLLEVIDSASGLSRTRAVGIARLQMRSVATGVRDTVRVRIRQVADSIAVSPPANILPYGDTIQLTAFAYDSNAVAIAGVSFVWTSLDTTRVRVDASGRAIGVGYGAAAVRAAARGLSGDAGVLVRNADSLSIEVVAGNGQAGVAGTVLPVPLRARVTNQFGEGIAGIPVSWWSPQNAQLSPVAPATDSAGFVVAVATLDTLARIGHAFATIGHDSIDFAFVGRPGPAVGFLRVSPASQADTAADAVTLPPRVRVVDQYNNGVPDLRVRFDPRSGSLVSAAERRTDITGHSTITWSLDSIVGRDTLFVSLLDTLDVGFQPIRFTATTLPDSASVLRSMLTAADTVRERDSTIVEVRLIDRFGNPLTKADGAVTFAAAFGSFDPTVNTNDGFYRAVFRPSGGRGTTSVQANLDGAALADVDTVLSRSYQLTWLGTQGTDMMAAGNWGTPGGPPSTLDSLYVTSATSPPSMPVTTQNMTVENVVLAGSATIDGPFDLTVTRDFLADPLNTAAMINGRLIMTGTATSISGGMRNLRVTGTTAAVGNVNVTGGRIVVQGGRLRSQGYRIRVRPN